VSAADGAAPRVGVGDEAEGVPARRHLPVVGRPLRAHTLSMRRQSKRELERLRVTLPTPDGERPLFRADCLPGGCNEARPCPFVTCGAHLALDVNEDNGNIKVNFPGRDGEPDLAAMPATCALDVADRGGIVLEELGAVMNLTRERGRQLEDIILAKLRGIDSLRGHLDDRATGEAPAAPLVFAPPKVDWFAESGSVSAAPEVEAAWAKLASPVVRVEFVEAPASIVVPEAVTRDHYRDEADAEIARLTADCNTLRAQRDAAEAEVARLLRAVGDGHAMKARLDRVREQRDEARALVGAVMAAGLDECERLRATPVAPVVLLDEGMFARLVAQASTEATRGVLRALAGAA